MDNYPVKSWPFRSIVFPFEYLKPQRFPAVSVTHEMWDAISDRALCCFSDAKGHCEPWRLKSSFAADNCPHSSNMVFVKTQSKSDDMQTFFFDEPGWGTEFVLARGAAVCCLAVYTPFGNNEYLGYRMEEDMKILKRIMEIRTAELKQQFSYAEPGIYENNSFSQG